MIGAGARRVPGEYRWHRYEAKYIIDEAQAWLVRSCCRNYLPPDPFATDRQDRGYPILSVYFDSPARALLYQAVNRMRYRYKLRVRCYRGCHEPRGDAPAFLEVKRKIEGIVQKTRAPVNGELAGELMRHGASGCAADPAANGEGQEFLALCRQLGAQPVVGVYYEREAYEGRTAERVRITLDRNLHRGLIGSAGGRYRELWQPARAGGVILEVKFTNTYPFWLSDLLHRLEVSRRGVCKYVICASDGGSGHWNFLR